MKKMKIVFFIRLYILFSIFFLVMLGIFVFSEPKCTDTKTWYVLNSSIYNPPSDTERLLITDSYEIPSIPALNLKKLKYVDIDTSKLKISDQTFSMCKNIEEITFYQNPKGSFDKNTFAKCPSLKVVNLVGNYEDWKDFQITVPIDCEIKFLLRKDIVVPESKVKNFAIKVINIANPKRDKKSGTTNAATEDAKKNENSGNTTM